MEGKFSSKLLVFVMGTTHNCDSFSCWSQMFHILPSIYEGIILPSEIGFFERVFLIAFMSVFFSSTNTTKKMPISDQEFLTDPKSPLKKSYLRWQNKALANTW